MSDGVHDNLDPQTLGKVPSELKLPNEAKWTSWDQVPHDMLARLKGEYMRGLLGEIVFSAGEHTSPSSITDRLINHCLEVTRKAREFMELNPNVRQPTDYVEFPGKMDHTTCVTFVVGRKAGSGGSPGRDNHERNGPDPNSHEIS